MKIENPGSANVVALTLHTVVPVMVPVMLVLLPTNGGRPVRQKYQSVQKLSPVPAVVDMHSSTKIVSVCADQKKDQTRRVPVLSICVVASRCASQCGGRPVRHKLW